jgi:hypothetical protein
MAEAINQEPKSPASQETRASEALTEFYQYYRMALEIARSTEEPADFEEFARLRGAIVDLQRTKEAMEFRQSGAMKHIAQWITSTMLGTQGVPLAPQSEEEIQLQAVIEECLNDIQRVREQMRSDQATIDELKAETKMLIAELKVAA